MDRAHRPARQLIVAAAALLLLSAGAASAQNGDDGAAARAVAELRAELRQQFDAVERAPWRDIERIRDAQRTFLKASQKFPDFIEIGPRVWEQVFDWHVRYRQPIVMTRTAEGRYVMTFMFTSLVLRPEQSDDYVGFGFDVRN